MTEEKTTSTLREFRGWVEERGLPLLEVAAILREPTHLVAGWIGLTPHTKHLPAKVKDHMTSIINSWPCGESEK
jgi:hypothetical protein